MKEERGKAILQPIHRPQHRHYPSVKFLDKSNLCWIGLLGDTGIVLLDVVVLLQVVVDVLDHHDRGLFESVFLHGYS